MSFKQPTNINEAVAVCTPIVNKLAHRWKRNHHHTFSDLQQAGFLGVCEAWNRFEGTKFQKNGYRFTTYAWWWIRACVRGEAIEYWNNDNNTVSENSILNNEMGKEINVDLMSALRAIERLPEDDRKIYMMRMEGATFDEIAEEIGETSLHKVRNRMVALNDQISI